MPEANVVTVTSENSAEFYASKLPQAPASPPAEAVEQTEPVVETQSGESEPEQEPAIEAESQHKPNPKIEKRFSELTRQREEAKRAAEAEKARADAAERKAQELEARLNPPKAAEPDAKPTPSQYTDAFEYAEALANWSAQNALKERDRQEIAKQQEAERAKLVTTWKDRQAAFEAQQPDYQEMIASSDVVVPDHIRDAILESDAGPQLLYHLAENPDVAQSLSAKSIIASLKELGKLEATLTAAKPVAKAVDAAPKISNAPAPINPLKGSNAPIDNLVDSDGNFTGTYQQFKALEKAGKI